LPHRLGHKILINAHNIFLTAAPNNYAKQSEKYKINFGANPGGWMEINLIKATAGRNLIK